MKKILCASLLLAFYGAMPARAQSIGPATLNAAGNSAVVAGNMYEWSVGEMTLVNTAAGSNVVVTQGLLQPVEDQGLSIKNRDWFKQHFRLYPNPASQVINLGSTLQQGGKLTLRVTDIVGREMQRKEYELPAGSFETAVDITSLLNGNYLLEMLFVNSKSHYNMVYKFQKQD
jgi:hypothetical protein